MLCALILILPSLCANFSRVTELLDAASEIIPHMAFSVSTADKGRVYTYEHGNMTMDSVVNVASTSKWFSGATIMRQVALGHLSLDEPVCKYLDWWSCNSTSDPFGVPRANVTLRIAMSFLDGTNGLEFGSCPNKESTYEECTKGLYNNQEVWKYVPNTTFDYNEMHLQIAGTVAQKVAGRGIMELLNDSLIALKMSDSFYEGGATPDISAELSTTGNDYEKFLSSLYHITFPDLNSNLLAEMESDYSVGKEYSPEGHSTQSFVGHYGLANWLDCGHISENNMTLWPWCVKDNIRSCIGLWGYYPVLDRRRKFWTQVVVGPSMDPAQVLLTVMLGRVVKDELNIILAPEIESMSSSCQYLSEVYASSSQDNEHVLDLANRFQDILQCIEE